MTVSSSAACALTPWVLRTIHWGYQLQFLSRPTCFGRVITTTVSEEASPVLMEEICVLLSKGAIQVVPQGKMEEGFYSRYFLLPIYGTSDITSSKCLQYVICYSLCIPGNGIHWWICIFCISQSTQGTENS